MADEPTLTALIEVIEDEMFARIAVHDKFETRDDARRVVELIADALLYRFDVRERATA
jgi:hypothetical protein